MTTNQTIDGVSRELIEKAMLACFEAGHGITHDELRALLNEPFPVEPFAQGVLVSRELIERISSRLNETGQFLLSEELHATVSKSAPIIGGEVDRLNGMLDAASELLRTKQRANRELRSELERIKAINDNNFKLVLDRLFEPGAPVVDGQDDQQMACMPVERCYDVRAKMIIAFNETKKAGGDLDDALDAAYKAALRYSPNPLSAEQPTPVAVVQDFGDPYQGALEDLSIFKRRALESEAKVREQDQIIDRLGEVINAENGPTHMGEPAVVAPTAWIKSDVAATLRKDDCCYAFGEQNPKGNLIPLYASPIAWKLPAPHGKQSNLKDTQYAMGWNACLDQLKRLNPSL